MKAVKGAGINELFGDCSRLGLGEKLKSPKGRLIPPGSWFSGGGSGRSPCCPGLMGCRLTVSKNELMCRVCSEPCLAEEPWLGL